MADPFDNQGTAKIISLPIANSHNHNGHNGNGQQNAYAWKPLSAEEQTQLDSEIAKLYPDDSKFVEKSPAAAEWRFWRSHERLWHCYCTAEAAGLSPSALLFACLLKISSVLPPEVTTGDLGKGAPISLGINVIFYGNSGKGKSLLWDVVKVSMPLDPEIGKIGQATAEGIRDHVACIGDKGKTVRTAYNVILHMDEGENLKALQQPGRNIMPTIRSLAHGKSSVLSTANAKSGVGHLEIKDYTLQFVSWINLQPSRVHNVFNEDNINDGTVQRFLFADVALRYLRRKENRCPMPPPLINVIPGELKPLGMNSTGMIDPMASHQTANAFARNVTRRQSKVPPSFIEYMERHEYASEAGTIEDVASHEALTVVQLAHLLAIYLRSQIDPIDSDLRAALGLLKFSKDTIKIVDRDIKIHEAKEDNDRGIRQGRRKASENKVIAYTNDVASTMQKIIDVLEEYNGAEELVSVLRKKCRIQKRTDHFDEAFRRCTTRKIIQIRVGDRKDMLYASLVDAENA